MRTIIKTTVFGLVLALSACGPQDGGGKAGKADGGKQAAKADGGDAKADAGEAAADAGGEVEAPEADPLDPKVEQAVTLANKISAEPENADAILEEAGLDRGTFDDLLYEIAKDPELSKSYAIARET